MARTSTRLKLWTGMPVNAPHVTPPISLRALLIVCILIPTGLLIYGTALRLASSTGTLESTTTIKLVLIYFALPIMVAVAINNNRPGSRALILFYTIVLIAEFVRAADTESVMRLAGTMLAAVALYSLAFAWLFLSKRMRAFYALIRHEPVPFELRQDALRVLAPGPAERRFLRIARVVAPYAEGAVVFAIIAGIVFAFAQM